jgi:hypothetical protein
MKLYKVTARNEKTNWVGSQADAAKARKTFTDAGYKRAEIDTDEHDIPTNKEGLLGWLNENCK